MKRRTRRLDYLERIIAAHAELRLPPQCTIAKVMHDDDCPMRRGKGTCRCQPAITLETTAGRIEVMPDGACRHMNALN